MKKKRVLLSTLALSMSLMAAPALAAEFTDMPEDYSTEALQTAVDNGLLNGSGDLINPDGDLTRGEFAAIMVRAFGASNEADISSYADVNSEAWYAEYLAKAVAMGIMEGDGENLNPTANITRQEVCTVMARAFSMTSDSNVDSFADSEDVSSWALESVAAMVDAGFIQGSDGAINPTANIVRKDFAVIMNRVVSNYATSADSLADYTEGSVVILSADVLVDDMTITGDLIIADGVDLADLNLSGVTIEGDIVIRSAGDVTLTDVTANSVKVTSVSEDTTVSVAGESSIENVVTVANNATIVISDNATVTTVEVTGSNAEIEVSGSATVESVTATGDDTTVNVADEATVSTVETSGESTSVEVSGSATVDSVATSGESSNVSVADDATVSDVEVVGDSSEISVSDSATVENATVSGSDSKVEVSDSAKVDSVVADGTGTTVTGDGTVGSVEANGNDTTVDTSGTDVSVSDSATGTTADGSSVESGGSTSTSGSTSSGSSSGGSSGGGVTRYTVSFDDQDSNDETNVESQTVTKGSNITLPTPDAYTGHTFLGWNTKADGSGTYYYADNTYTPTSATTFYAIWSFEVSGEDSESTLAALNDAINDGEIFITLTGNITLGDGETLEIPAGVTLTIDSGTITVNGNGTLTNSGTIYVDNATTLETVLGEVEGGTVVIYGDIDLAASVTVESGVTLIVEENAKLTIKSTEELGAARTLTVVGTLENNGTITVEVNDSGTSGTLKSDAGSTITNNGTITANSTATFSGDFTNNGTITADSSLTFKATLTNNDTITAHSLSIDGTSTNNGTITVTDNITISGSASLTNTGTLTINGDIANIEGALSNEGTIEVSTETALKKVLAKVTSGKVVVTANITTDNAITVAAGVTLTIEDGVELNITNKLTNNGTIVNYGIINYDSLEGNAVTEGEVGIAATEVTTYAKLSDALTDGKTNITITADITLEDAIEIPAGTTLIINENATLTCGSYTITVSEGGTLTNNGAITVTSEAALTSALEIGGNVVITGEIEVETLTVPENVTLTVDYGATLTVSGTLTVTGEIINNGTIYVASADNLKTAIAIGGDIVMTNTVTVTSDLEIPAGTTLTVNFGDTLTVSGTLTVTGTLNANGTVSYGSLAEDSEITEPNYSQITSFEMLKAWAALTTPVAGTITADFAITDAFEIPESTTLNVAANTTLTIESDEVLTVTGTLTNSGTIAVNDAANLKTLLGIKDNDNNGVGGTISVASSFTTASNK